MEIWEIWETWKIKALENLQQIGNLEKLANEENLTKFEIVKIWKIATWTGLEPKWPRSQNGEPKGQKGKTKAR